MTSAEYLAIQDKGPCIVDRIASAVGSNWLKVALQAKGFISSEKCTQGSEHEKVSELIEAVKSKIKYDPNPHEPFGQFITILQENAAIRDVGQTVDKARQDRNDATLRQANSPVQPRGSHELVNLKSATRVHSGGMADMLVDKTSTDGSITNSTAQHENSIAGPTAMVPGLERTPNLQRKFRIEDQMKHKDYCLAKKNEQIQALEAEIARLHEKVHTLEQEKERINTQLEQIESSYQEKEEELKKSQNMLSCKEHEFSKMKNEHDIALQQVKAEGEKRIEDYEAKLNQSTLQLSELKCDMYKETYELKLELLRKDIELEQSKREVFQKESELQQLKAQESDRLRKNSISESDKLKVRLLEQESEFEKNERQRKDLITENAELRRQLSEEDRLCKMCVLL